MNPRDTDDYYPINNDNISERLLRDLYDQSNVDKRRETQAKLDRLMELASGSTNPGGLRITSSTEIRMTDEALDLILSRMEALTAVSPVSDGVL